MKRIAVYTLIFLVFLSGCGEKKGVEKPNIQKAQTKSVENMQEKLNLVVRNSFESYCRIPDEFLSLNESDDKVYKNKLLARYREVFTGQILNDFTAFVDQGNIESGYFNSFFEEEKGIQIKDIKIQKYNDQEIYGSALSTHLYRVYFFDGEYNTEYSTFVDEFKVMGLSQIKLNNLIEKNDVSSVDINQTDRYDFRMKEVDGVWKFNYMKSQPIKTEIKQLYDGNDQPVRFSE